MSQPPDELSQEIELVTRVASLYYLEDVTQGETADALGLSRPRVGWLLKKARAADRGHRPGMRRVRHVALDGTMRGREEENPS